MKEVTVVFSCGHEGRVTAQLDFTDGEEIPVLCRECKPSRIVALLWVGMMAAVGAMVYGAVIWDGLTVMGGGIGAAVDAFLLFIFRR